MTPSGSDSTLEEALSGNNFTLTQLEERGWVLPSDTPISLWLKSFEGYSSQAQWDVAQNTNGFGTKATSSDETISIQEAQNRLLARIEDDQKVVEEFGKEYDYTWTDNEREALGSFIFNGGEGFLKLVSGLFDYPRDEEGNVTSSNLISTGKPKRSKEEIAEMMLLYVNAGGEYLQGLADRRELENALFTGKVTI